MWKYFTSANTRKYIDILPELALKYNSSYHRMIRMSPLEVNRQNVDTVWLNLYQGKIPVDKHSIKKEMKRNKLSIGDTVRIAIERTVFRKGYNEGWTEEIFLVKHILSTSPVTYKLSDQGGEDIKGTFYVQELQKVSEPDTYRIEKVIRKKTDKEGKLWYLVKWRGYSSNFNSFVAAEDLKRL